MTLCTGITASPLRARGIAWGPAAVLEPSQQALSVGDEACKGQPVRRYRRHRWHNCCSARTRHVLLSGGNNLIGRQDKTPAQWAGWTQLHGERHAQRGLVEKVDGAAAHGVQVCGWLVGICAPGDTSGTQPKAQPRRCGLTAHSVNRLDGRDHRVSDGCGERIIGRHRWRRDVTVRTQDQLRKGVPVDSAKVLVGVANLDRQVLCRGSRLSPGSRRATWTAG